MTIVPVILSGGTGTRLWPLSRASQPKQFLSFSGGASLFQETILRCQFGNFAQRPIVVAAEAHRFFVTDALEAVGAEADILLEPVPRNSCAAIAAGCLQALERDRDAIVLALAADHHIPDKGAFCALVAEGVEDASAGWLLTFGVKPDRAATGYGYILPGDRLQRAFKVERFVEKPTRERAEEFLEAGYLWNSGNFLFRAAAFLEELGRLQPDVLSAVDGAWRAARSDLQFRRLDPTSFGRAPGISVDFAVMEKTARAAVLAVDYAWSDVGNWDAVSIMLPADSAGNRILGDATIINGNGNIVHSEGNLTALIGLDGLAVVSTRDCVLVVPRHRAEEVKGLVTILQKQERSEANAALQVFRPWGSSERLESGAGYQVKRIVVKPGGELSLQKHQFRAEHWVVVHGRAEVTVEGVTRELGPNESTFIPLGCVHRLTNRAAEPVVLIEVQTGLYLGEDDIIRLDDAYNREDGASQSQPRQPAGVMEEHLL